MRNFLRNLLVLFVSIESQRILIFTSDLTELPNLNAFLTRYDFGITGHRIDVYNV